MKNKFVSSLVSSILSIMPVVIVICILAIVFQCMPEVVSGLNVYKFKGSDFGLLFTGAAILIIGLTLFQVGVDSSLSKVGEYMGGSLSKQSNLFIIIIFSFILGALITCAEPSIIIVSQQININQVLLITVISVGVGLFVVIGVLRIIYHGSLKIWYLIFYFVTFALIALVCVDPDVNKENFLPFIFDAGGVTTGSSTVPFILSLSVGIAIVRGGRKANEDSFGLVGMASVGPIMTMAILILLTKNSTMVIQYPSLSGSIVDKFLVALLGNGYSSGSILQTIIALSPIIVIFFIYELIFIRLPKREIIKLLIGFLYSFVGLSLFLAAASAAMTPFGYVVGKNIGVLPDLIIILIAFFIGFATILCEPAVHVLTKQMEVVSDGRITKKVVLISLAIGVGTAIALAAFRAVYNFNILYIVVPGYILSLVMMFFCPGIYTAMAFDSGGTASGPMSSSFVFPLVVGIVTSLYSIKPIESKSLADTIYSNGFGVVALIALIPIIVIQILGIKETLSNARLNYYIRKEIVDKDDAQIIHF